MGKVVKKTEPSSESGHSQLCHGLYASSALGSHLCRLCQTF